MATPAPILCFTDVLCGLCYVAEARLAQLKADFGDEVQLCYHFMSVYGDVRRRIDKRGLGDCGYAAMVRKGLARYDHVEVHPELFDKERPTSSVPAHLYLRAVKLLEDDGVLTTSDGSSLFESLMWELRLAFFRDLRDISKREVLDEIAEAQGISSAEITRVIDDGRAFAELSYDSELQRKHSVAVTPTLVLNEGRQLLNGNVGYRAIEANVRELLSQKAGKPSWC
jgi:predicted DsbA family dithiol-disulfide isomerase